ncbi:MAG: MBL fold metallo-hydrolase [bacterium]
MEIKIIAEASTRLQRLFVGWGVSFLMDNDLLFDTFSNGRILKRNLKRLNINTNGLKYVIVSHEHGDHYGGLWNILQENPDMKVFICQSFSKEFKEKLNKFNATIVECQDITRIKENIFTTGEIIGEYDGKPLVEQSLIIRNEKVSIITGCSHPGIIEIIKRVKEHFAEPLHLVLGGFHLHDKPSSEVIWIVNEFKNFGIEKVAPCHCTGDKAVKMFQQQFKDDFIEISAGSKIVID